MGSASPEFRHVARATHHFGASVTAPFRRARPRVDRRWQIVARRRCPHAPPIPSAGGLDRGEIVEEWIETSSNPDAPSSPG